MLTLFFHLIFIEKRDHMLFWQPKTILTEHVRQTGKDWFWSTFLNIMPLVKQWPCTLILIGVRTISYVNSSFYNLIRHLPLPVSSMRVRRFVNTIRSFCVALKSYTWQFWWWLGSKQKIINFYRHDLELGLELQDKSRKLDIAKFVVVNWA